MKVYAEFTIDNRIEYRQITLLQFGSSWQLIGSAVLKNPGSPSPLSKVSEQDYSNIVKLVSEDCKSKEKWYNFSTDSTMRFLEKIFNGQYAPGKSSKLNGVIQLFNIYYIGDQDVLAASNKLNENSSQFIYPKYNELVSSFKSKPVYLGWRNECYRNEETIHLAKKIFQYVSNSTSMYLDEKFKNNEFNHQWAYNYG